MGGQNRGQGGCIPARFPFYTCGHALLSAFLAQGRCRLHPGSISLQALSICSFSCPCFHRTAVAVPRRSVTGCTWGLMYAQQLRFLGVPEVQMKAKLAVAPRDANRAVQWRPRGGVPCSAAVTRDAAAKPGFPPCVA